MLMPNSLAMSSKCVGSRHWRTVLEILTDCDALNCGYFATTQFWIRGSMCFEDLLKVARSQCWGFETRPAACAVRQYSREVYMNGIFALSTPGSGILVLSEK